MAGPNITSQPLQEEPVRAMPDPALLGVAADVADRIALLPAVATLDWCDRAAECHISIPGVRVAGVWILTLSPAGRIVDLEAAGFASADPEDHARDRLLSMRSRADSLRTLGWNPEERALSPRSPQPAVWGLLSTLAGGDNWRLGPIGALLGDYASLEPVTAWLPLGTSVPGRCLISLAAAASCSAPAAAAVLGAVMPCLHRRALRAIGPARSARNHWLSPKEQLVLELLILGNSVREIADRIGRSPHTVHDHVKALHRKLGASSRGELVARALGHLAPADPGAIMAEPKS